MLIITSISVSALRTKSNLAELEPLVFPTIAFVEEATNKFIPVPPAIVNVFAVVVAFRIKIVLVCPAVPINEDNVEVAGKVKVAFCTLSV